MSLCILFYSACSFSIDVECDSTYDFCSSKAGEMNAGEMNAGEMNAGVMNAGEMNAGEMNAGEMNAGEMNAGVTPYHTQECQISCEVDWISVNSGSFTLGSLLSDDEQPLHTVRLSAFDISLSEVTVGQYSLCVAAGHCQIPEYFEANSTDLDSTLHDITSRDLSCHYYQPDSWSKPMNCINYCEIQNYIDWLSAELDDSVRLLSEAEWVYAATNQAQTTYPWGEQAAECDKAHLLGCEPKGSREVCSLLIENATSSAACDLIGNVSEWVADAYRDSFEGAPSDSLPVPFEGQICNEGLITDELELSLGIVKGGDWQSTQANSRANNRVPTRINIKSDRIGFRVARARQPF